jgi:small subunit ribosomal protein S16
MVKIRLYRTGTTNRPYYRVVAVDHRKKRQGRVLESLGTYDPRGGGRSDLDLPAVERWVSRGAQLSETVRSLVKKSRRQAPSAPAA